MTTDHHQPLPLDPEDMLGAVAGLPDQIDAAWRRVRTLALPEGYRDVDGVVLAGMGGSAIGGDLAASLLANELPVRMSVVRDYRLPAWVGPRTLCITSSFSGGTEETLAAFDDAKRRGAHVAAITSGGALADLAHRAGAPIIPLPAGGQPRAALGASLASVLGVLHAAALIGDQDAVLGEATAGMRALLATAGPGAPGGDRPGGLADALVGRVPFVYAPEDLAPVARRWKTQLNENAKSAAAWDTLPELDHNTVAGYACPDQLSRISHVVILTGPGTAPRIAKRIEVTAGLLEDHAIPHTVVAAPAGHRVAEALWLVLFGDLASVYLAYRYGIDPTPVEAIIRLKAALRDG